MGFKSRSRWRKCLFDKKFALKLNMAKLHNSPISRIRDSSSPPSSGASSARPPAPSKREPPKAGLIGVVPDEFGVEPDRFASTGIAVGAEFYFRLAVAAEVQQGRVGR